MDSSNIKALIFDVFGTVVDWRSSVIREAERFGGEHGLARDWEAFAVAWRGKYRPYMDKVRSGELPWTNLDRLHRMSLDEALAEFDIEGIDEEAKDELNLAWRRLDPWPDAVPGLYRLKRRFIVAPMSNGNVALMTNMARYAGLPWDCVLGAELARHLQAGPGKLPDGGGAFDAQAGASDDGGRPPGRPAGGAKGGAAVGFRPAADGVWARQPARPYSRPVFRRGGRRLRGLGGPARGVSRGLVLMSPCGFALFRLCGES